VSLDCILDCITTTRKPAIVKFDNHQFRLLQPVQIRRGEYFLFGAFDVYFENIELHSTEDLDAISGRYGIYARQSLTWLAREQCVR